MSNDDRSMREYAASLPLAERQQMAREMHYIDGKPLTEDDIRHVIRKVRGTLTRDEVLRLRPAEDVTCRRIGSLNPDEFDVIFAEEWPV